MMSGGRQRDAIVHVPTGYTGAAPVPLVVVMHGYTETDDQIRVVSGFDAAADANGLLVVYPQGTDLSWNAGKCCGNAPKNGVDDVGYVRDLIDRMSQDYCVDPKRVFATGFSNGGMLSNRLACELSDRIAAIGPVAGPLAMDTCSPSRPVPVIEFHGTADPVVWWGGAPLSGTPAVETNVANWAKRDGCTDPSGTQVYAQGDVTCTRWSQCAGGSAVELCKVNDGGHQWPGGQSAGPFGKLTQDVDATARMVEFFLAHGM
jgi:polyhydroxybutyrate depolymerase